MGTYWNDFLEEYPWVKKCPLEKILELFWLYCKNVDLPEGKDNFFDIEGQLARARQQVEESPDNSAKQTQPAICPPDPNYCQLCKGLGTVYCGDGGERVCPGCNGSSVGKQQASA